MRKMFLEPANKKILIYGTFFHIPLLQEIDVTQCPYYQPYDIKRSQKVDDFDFDIVILHFKQHERFM
ncbi:hypothetical protein MXB_2894, partial [Myxobolus squamalis]